MEPGLQMACLKLSHFPSLFLLVWTAGREFPLGAGELAGSSSLYLYVFMFDTHSNFLPSKHCSLKKKGHSWWCFQSNDCGNCRLFHDSLCCRYRTQVWCLLQPVTTGWQCVGTVDSWATPVSQTLVFSGLARLKVSMGLKVPENWNVKRSILFLPSCQLFFVVSQCVTHTSWTKQVIDELQSLLYTTVYRNTEEITEQKWTSGMKVEFNRDGTRGKMNNFLP